MSVNLNDTLGRLPPVWTTVLVACGIYAVELLLMPGGDGRWGVLSMGLNFAVLMGLAPYVVTHSHREFGAIRPVLTLPSKDFEHLRERAHSIPVWVLALASILGICIAIAMYQGSSQRMVSRVLDRDPDSARLSWTLVVACLNWGTTFSFATAGAWIAIAYRTAGARTKPSLFERAPLRPFSSVGIRLSFAASASLAITAGFLVVAPIPKPDLVGALATAGLAGALAGVYLLVCLTGVRKALEREKTAELDRVQSELAGTPAGAEARRVELLQYVRELEGLSTWAIDTPRVGRLLLVLLLPLGSWIGGAIVERVVDRILE